MKLIFFLISILVIAIVLFVVFESYKYKELIHAISPDANILVVNQKRDMMNSHEIFMIYVENFDDKINALFENLLEQSKHYHFRKKWGTRYLKILDIEDDYNILFFHITYYENSSAEGTWSITMPFKIPENFFQKDSEILYVLNSIPGVSGSFFISKNNNRYSIVGTLYAVDYFPTLQDLLDYAEADVGQGGGAIGREN